MEKFVYVLIVNDDDNEVFVETKVFDSYELAKDWASEHAKSSLDFEIVNQHNPKKTCGYAWKNYVRYEIYHRRLNG